MCAQCLNNAITVRLHTYIQSSNAFRVVHRGGKGKLNTFPNDTKLVLATLNVFSDNSNTAAMIHFVSERVERKNENEGYHNESRACCFLGGYNSVSCGKCLKL